MAKRKKHPLSSQGAHTRTVKAWITKHERYHYGHNAGFGMHEFDPEEDDQQEFEDESDSEILRKHMMDKKPGDLRKRISHQAKVQREKSGEAARKHFEEAGWKQNEEGYWQHEAPNLTHELEAKIEHPDKAKEQAEKTEAYSEGSKIVHQRRRFPTAEEVVEERGRKERVTSGDIKPKYGFPLTGVEQDRDKELSAAARDLSVKSVGKLPPDRVPLKPSSTTPEQVYDRYKQEKRSKRGATRYNLPIGKKEEIYSDWHETDDPDYPGGWKRDKEEKGGWKRTLAFEREQSRRSKEARRQGLNSRGWKLWGDYGTKVKQAPEEKADIGVGSNWEHRIVTRDFEPLNPEDVYTKQGKFAVRFDHELPESGTSVSWDAADPEFKKTEITAQKDLPTFKLALSELGLRGSFVSRANDDPNTYIVTLPEGKHLSHEEYAEVEQRLDETFNISKTPGDHPSNLFKYEDIPMQQKVVRAPLGASKVAIPDSKIDPMATFRVQKYTSPVNYSLGRRNEQGELLPNEKDTLAVKVKGRKAGRYRLYGDRVGYVHFKDRSDAVGWGTSYRPGEEEVGRAVMAIPTARDQYRLGEAAEAYDKGNSDLMDQYIDERFPDAVSSTDPEIRQKQRDKLREELAGVAAAGGSAAYYTARKSAVKSGLVKGAEKTWGAAEHIPGVKDWGVHHNIKSGITGLAGDVQSTYVDQTKGWYQRQKTRVRHPLRDVDEPHVAGVHWNIMPENEKLRYRQGFIEENKRQARQIEKENRALLRTAKTQQSIKGAIGDEPTTIKGRLAKRSALKTAGRLQYDPEYKKGVETFSERLERHRAQSQAVLNDEHPLPREWRQGEAASRALRNTEKLDPNVALTPEEEGALKAWQEHGFEGVGNTKLVPSGVKRAGKYGLIGAAVAGAGIYAYDKHKQHQDIDFHDSNTFRDHLPETIVRPTVQVKRTKTKTIPHNNLTDFLEVGGRKVGTGYKASIKKKQTRIRNFKDVAGDPYQSAPIVGGVQLKRPGPVEGSRRGAVLGTPKGKQITIKGRGTGLYADVGKKERWNDGSRRRKLKSSNPARVSEKEREELAILYTRGNDFERDQIMSMHGGDEDLREMLEDPYKMDEVSARHKNLYVGKGQEKARKRLDTKKRQDQWGHTIYGEGDPAELGNLYGRTLSEARRSHETWISQKRDMERERQGDYSPDPLFNTRQHSKRYYEDRGYDF